jgi:glutathione S-transferase
MLEDAGADYSNSADKLYGPDGRMDSFRGSALNVTKELPDFPPLFFPPAIWHRPKDGSSEVRINQVAACMTYLGEALGYKPATAAERARADMITQNALDYLSAGRSSFHPVNNAASYHDQKEEGDKQSMIFSQTKMLVFLNHFEKVLKSHKNRGGPVAGGENLTYADFALYHVLNATISQFNNDVYNFAWDAAALPLLKAFYKKIHERPNIVAYHASRREPPFDTNSMM